MDSRRESREKMKDKTEETSAWNVLNVLWIWYCMILLKLILWVKALKKHFRPFFVSLPFHEIIRMALVSMKHRDLITQKFFFLFFKYEFKNMPPKTPQLPCVPKVSHKSKASCVCPYAALKHPIFCEYLDLPSMTALHAFESCIYIFFLLYDNLFSSSSPQVLRILSPFQKSCTAK